MQGRHWVVLAACAAAVLGGGLAVDTLVEQDDGSRPYCISSASGELQPERPKERGQGCPDPGGYLVCADQRQPFTSASCSAELVGDAYAGEPDVVRSYCVVSTRSQGTRGLPAGQLVVMDDPTDPCPADELRVCGDWDAESPRIRSAPCPRARRAPGSGLGPRRSRSR